MAAAARRQTPETPAAPAVHTPKVGPSVVTVACKMHVALFELELCAGATITENTQVGPREVKMFHKTGEKVVVRGLAFPAGQVPEGFRDRPRIVAGYALTSNVPKAFWDEWVKQHAKAPYVVNKMIVAYPSEADIAAVGAETKGVLSGLEPVQRSKDKITDTRVVKSIDENKVTSIQPGEK